VVHAELSFCRNIGSIDNRSPLVRKSTILQVEITNFRESDLNLIECKLVDRAGFEPATFRTLDLEFAKRTIFGPVGIPD
jgi:hypothetical protein